MWFHLIEVQKTLQTKQCIDWEGGKGKGGCLPSPKPLSSGPSFGDPSYQHKGRSSPTYSPCPYSCLHYPPSIRGPFPVCDVSLFPPPCPSPSLWGIDKLPFISYFLPLAFHICHLLSQTRPRAWQIIESTQKGHLNWELSPLSVMSSIKTEMVCQLMWKHRIFEATRP